MVHQVLVCHTLVMVPVCVIENVVATVSLLKACIKFNVWFGVKLC